MRRAIAISALCFWGLAQADWAPAADPFYEQLMETGILSYARGDYPNAAEDLRLACFGLLEEPVALAEGLTYLALAQAELDDVAAFTRTFDRILEVERMFQAFSQLDLAGELRRALDQRLMSWIPYEVLDRSPVFRDVARRKRAAQILELPPEERRRELDLQLAAEPDHPTWLLLSAELDLASGEFDAAWTAADALLESTPSPRALCVRGRAGAVLGRCEQALEDLALCDASEASRELIAARLRCLVSLQDWDDAALALGELSADERKRPPFRQLSREISRGRKAAAEAAAAEAETGEEEAPAPPPEEAIAEATGAPPAEEPAAGEMDARPTAPPPTGEPAVAAVAETGPSPGTAAGEAMPDDDADRIRAGLERIGRLLRTGSRAELEAAFAEARQLADRHPQLAEPQLLTADIAYRLSRWQDAVTYFGRAGEVDSFRPERQFYLAVALYEAGEPGAAREALERCLAFLEPTDFVRSYTEKILNSG